MVNYMENISYPLSGENKHIFCMREFHFTLIYCVKRDMCNDNAKSIIWSFWYLLNVWYNPFAKTNFENFSYGKLQPLVDLRKNYNSFSFT